MTGPLAYPNDPPRQGPPAGLSGAAAVTVPRGGRLTPLGIPPSLYNFRATFLSRLAAGHPERRSLPRPLNAGPLVSGQAADLIVRQIPMVPQ